MYLRESERERERERVVVGGTTTKLPTTTLKTGLHGVMLNAIKDLSVSFSSPIGFKVKWHNSRSNKWYQRQGHGFESQECHCEKWIVRVGHNLT